MRFRRALLLACLVACLVGAANAGWTQGGAGASERPTAIERAPATTLSIAAYVTPPPIRSVRFDRTAAVLVAVALLLLAAAADARRRDRGNPVPAFRSPAPRLRGPPVAAAHG